MQEINDNFDLRAPRPMEAKYLKFNSGTNVFEPYASKADANATINIAYRHLNLIVIIDSGTGPTRWWYKEGVTDDDLVPLLERYDPTIIPFGVLDDTIVVTLTAEIVTKYGYPKFQVYVTEDKTRKTEIPWDVDAPYPSTTEWTFYTDNSIGYIVMF